MLKTAQMFIISGLDLLLIPGRLLLLSFLLGLAT